MIAAVPRDGVDEIIVVDGGSRDRTVARARAAGATVLVDTAERGYGRACAGRRSGGRWRARSWSFSTATAAIGPR